MGCAETPWLSILLQHVPGREPAALQDRAAAPQPPASTQRSPAVGNFFTLFSRKEVRISWDLRGVEGRSGSEVCSGQGGEHPRPLTPDVSQSMTQDSPGLELAGTPPGRQGLWLGLVLLFSAVDPHV